MTVEKKWWYKKHQTEISISEYHRDELNSEVLRQLNYTENKSTAAKTVIDWSKVGGKSSFFFDYEENEEEISRLLAGSNLVSYDNLMLDIDTKTVIELGTGYFIENWSDFFEASNNMGFMVSSKPIRLVMEFTEDGYLFSNFLIEK